MMEKFLSDLMWGFMFFLIVIGIIVVVFLVLIVCCKLNDVI